MDIRKINRVVCTKYPYVWHTIKLMGECSAYSSLHVGSTVKSAA